MRKLIQSYDAWRQRGAYIIFFALMMPILMVGLALATDAGVLYLRQAQLQNAADAAALAGAAVFQEACSKSSTDASKEDVENYEGTKGKAPHSETTQEALDYAKAQYSEGQQPNIQIGDSLVRYDATEKIVTYRVSLIDSGIPTTLLRLLNFRRESSVMAVAEASYNISASSSDSSGSGQGSGTDQDWRKIASEMLQHNFIASTGKSGVTVSSSGGNDNGQTRVQNVLQQAAYGEASNFSVVKENDFYEIIKGLDGATAYQSNFSFSGVTYTLATSDITFTCEKTTFSGILYAPNANVTINTKPNQFPNISGCIIAKTITFKPGSNGQLETPVISKSNALVKLQEEVAKDTAAMPLRLTR